MTSYYARTGQLSLSTHAWAGYDARPGNLNTRLNFYMSYFQDVVPSGVTVRHVPSDGPVQREEIQLLTNTGKLFMSGLISHRSDHSETEQVAADEAFTKWLDGDFVPDLQNWRFFTGLAELRLFKSHEGDSWKMTKRYRPMDYPDRVAEFLQEQYNSLRH